VEFESPCYNVIIVIENDMHLPRRRIS